MGQQLTKCFCNSNRSPFTEVGLTDIITTYTSNCCCTMRTWQKGRLRQSQTTAIKVKVFQLMWSSHRHLHMQEIYSIHENLQSSKNTCRPKLRQPWLPPSYGPVHDRPCGCIVAKNMKHSQIYSAQEWE